MTAPAPQLWSLAQFQNQTGGVGLLAPARGKLAAVDAMLVAWNNGQCADPSRALARLMNVCRTWLVMKEGKGTKLANARRVAVQALAAQAFARLQHVSFELNKQRAQAAPAIPGRGLQGGYAHERTTYLASNKQSALSGSTASALIHNAASVGIVNPPNFDTMNQKQFTDLINDHAPGMAFETEVDFFTKSQRMGRMIVIRDGRMYMSASTPFSTSNEEWAWAMDTYGNFYSTDQNVEVLSLPAHKRFNHSSLNAGKDVICAGIVRAVDGYILQIDNASGHYKPRRADVVQALQMLHDLGYDFDGNTAGVRIMEMVGGQLQWSVYRDAKTLLGNANAQPDAVQ